LGYLEKFGGRPKSDINDYRLEISIQTTQRKVCSDYMSSVMDKISKLNDIDWGKNE
jgi:hypothetical protein